MSAKILIVGPAWVGDMMMAHTLFQLLRQQNPTAEIDVLAPAWSQALLARMPEVHHGIALPFSHGQLQLRERHQFAKQLRKTNYDQAILLPNSLKSALIPFWASIPKRTGWLGEYRFGLLNDIHFLDKKVLPKMVERFAALAFPAHAQLPDNLPMPQLYIQAADVDLALKKHHLHRPLKPMIALCPGAEYGPAKRWPSSHYATVANQKLSEGWEVWLFGSPNDRESGDDIQAMTNQQCVNLIGKTALADAVDILSLADVVVANDSGLMHIAAALNRPVIALYGSTAPEFAPPLSSNAAILKTNLACQPCAQRTCPLKHHQCMKSLLPEKVLKAISLKDENQ